MSVKSNQNLPKKIWMGLVTFLSLVVCLLTWRVFISGDTVYQGVEIVMPYMKHQLETSAFSFFIHFIFAPLALLVMPLQFMPVIRKKYIGLHRWLGRAYVIAVIFGGIGGMLMAFNTDSGQISAVGFGTLAFLWVLFTVLAWVAIRKKNIDEHKRWMMRSASLTFAAITLRIFTPIGLILDEAGLFPFTWTYIFVAWHWVITWAVAEWWMARYWPKRKAQAEAA